MLKKAVLFREDSCYPRTFASVKIGSAVYSANESRDHNPMTRRIYFLSLILFACSAAAAADTPAITPPLIPPVASAQPAPAFGKGDIRFNRDIRPILSDNCFHCHGADPGSRKAKLRLDREEGFFEKRDDSPTVVRGKPADSPLYQRITSDDADEVMPPPKSEKKLTAQEKELLKKWIAEGAPWEAHWSFIKPEMPELPKVRDEKWARNPIDRFVLAKLEAAGLHPAPEANKRALARRLSLDLTGLPPEPALADAFDADASPDAYEKLVDKLLASPRYGEHRARYWLDAARYADTHGMHFDNFRDIWPYRDWVINAFNRNEPFNQFTLEQLAGDLLPNPTQDQLIATGFHRCNITTNEGGTIAEENLCNYARDRVETTSWVWLGLTANCAVCHDHKFDPITQKDFYSMSAFFRNTTQGALDGNIRDTAPILVMPKGADETRWNILPKEVDSTNKAIAELKQSKRAEFEKWLAQAKPEDWESSIDKNGAPEFHMPLIGPAAQAPKPGAPRPANFKNVNIVSVSNAASVDAPDVKKEAPAITAVLNDLEIEATSKEPLVFSEDGKLGSAPVLNGAKSPIVAPGSIGDFELDQPHSFGCWVKVPKDFKGGGSIFARMDDTDNFRGWDLFIQETEFATHFVHKWPADAIKVVTTGKQLKPGTWQHIFIAYDGSGKGEGFKIYVDGREPKLKIETNKLRNTTKTTTPFTVASRSHSNSPLNGIAVQDIRIYERHLAAAEVKQLALQPRMRAVLSKNAKNRSAQERDELFEIQTSGDPDVLALSEKVVALEAEKKTIRDRSPVGYIMEEKPNSMPVANILARGDYSKPKEKVEPTVFAALHKLPTSAPHNRLGLAQWIVSPENPLTPRVIVNRYWQEIFGTGIVKTSEDFGIMGEPPTHEQLIDWLAVDFRDNGGDIKRTIKQIVMSATYRQSPQTTREKIEKDPYNRLLSRGPRFRMDAEMVRDTALAASGLLSEKVGGSSVHPYQPDGVWDVVGMPESNTRHYIRDTGDSLYRRSMYTFWKRSAPPASMEIFNATNREVSCIRRERTDTPLQALVTLNDPQFVEAARVLAQHTLTSSPDTAARITYIAKRTLARPFTEKENAIVLKILEDLLKNYTEKPGDAKALLAVGEAKVDATLNPAELAAWTMVCNQVLNLDEALNK